MAGQQELSATHQDEAGYKNIALHRYVLCEWDRNFRPPLPTVGDNEEVVLWLATSLLTVLWQSFQTANTKWWAGKDSNLRRQ